MKKLITKITLLRESAHGHANLQASLRQHGGGANLLTLVFTMAMILA